MSIKKCQGLRRTTDHENEYECSERTGMTQTIYKASVTIQVPLTSCIMNTRKTNPPKS